jgi:hypothetical protein
MATWTSSEGRDDGRHHWYKGKDIPLSKCNGCKNFIVFSTKAGTPTYPYGCEANGSLSAAGQRADGKTPTECKYYTAGSSGASSEKKSKGKSGGISGGGIFGAIGKAIANSEVVQETKQEIKKEFSDAVSPAVDEIKGQVTEVFSDVGNEMKSQVTGALSGAGDEVKNQLMGSLSGSGAMPNMADAAAKAKEAAGNLFGGIFGKKK